MNIDSETTGWRARPGTLQGPSLTTRCTRWGASPTGSAVADWPIMHLVFGLRGRTDRRWQRRHSVPCAPMELANRGVFETKEVQM